MANPKKLNQKQATLLQAFTAEHKKLHDHITQIQATRRTLERLQGERRQQKIKLKEAYRQARQAGVPQNQMANKINATAQALHAWLNK